MPNLSPQTIIFYFWMHLYSTDILRVAGISLLDQEQTLDQADLIPHAKQIDSQST